MVDLSAGPKSRGNQTIIPVPLIQSKLSSRYNCTPASCRASSISLANNLHSRQPFSGKIPTSVTFPLICCRASNCALVQGRACMAIILDCCALLIPSSNTNKKIVQTASKPIPATTSQNATLWTAGEYLGRSKIIPTPTAMPIEIYLYTSALLQCLVGCW